jgi:hypothetical protein
MEKAEHQDMKSSIWEGIIIRMLPFRPKTPTDLMDDRWTGFLSDYGECPAKHGMID